MSHNSFEERRIIEKMQLWEAVQHWKARGEKFHIFEWLNDLFHKINEDFDGEIFKPHVPESIKIDSEVTGQDHRAPLSAQEPLSL